jgi:hypothetical protein
MAAKALMTFCNIIDLESRAYRPGSFGSLVGPYLVTLHAPVHGNPVRVAVRPELVLDHPA